FCLASSKCLPASAATYSLPTDPATPTRLAAFGLWATISMKLCCAALLLGIGLHLGQRGEVAICIKAVITHFGCAGRQLVLLRQRIDVRLALRRPLRPEFSCFLPLRFRDSLLQRLQLQGHWAPPCCE